VETLLERVREIRAALEAGDPVRAAQLMEAARLADPANAQGLDAKGAAALKAAVDEVLALALRLRERQFEKLAAGNTALRAAAVYQARGRSW
jgi:hypothetical protein